MSNNIITGIPWSWYPTGTKKEYIQADQKRNEKVDSTAIKVDDQQSEVDQAKALSQANTKSIEIINGSLSGINQSVRKNTGGVEANKALSEANAESIKVINADMVTKTDYAQPAEGGVVLLAALIAQLPKVSQSVSPAAYDQANDQAFRDSVTLSLNEIIDKINEVIKGQQSARQMDHP